MAATLQKTKIAVIGECLIELSGSAFGTLQQSFGGDTFNTALYMARLGRSTTAVKYVTALGGDSLSEYLLDQWQAEGIEVDLTLRDPDRLPGLYQIETDDRGERRFLYWRGQSAARYLLQHPDAKRVTNALSHVDLIYLSAISLAILPATDRTTLIELLTSLSRRGVAIAFDTNYRAALWPAVAAARACITAMLPATRVVFATFDDEQRLWGDVSPDATIARLRAAQIPAIVLKLGAAGCIYSNGTVFAARTSGIAQVLDTTAAGDSFNAAFLAAWLSGRRPDECCKAGNALAGVVIQHRGAIIPATATPSLAALLAERIPGPGAV